MQEANAREEAIHHTYEQQVTALNAEMLEQLWARVSTVASTLEMQVARDGERTLVVTDRSSGRTLRLVADGVLDLPEDERPGPFRMGNARITITAWDGTRREWLLRNVSTGDIHYAWVTLPGDVQVDDAMLGALVNGLRQGQMPPDPAETAHLSSSDFPLGGGAPGSGGRWGIFNLYSGARRNQDEVFTSGDQAGNALKEMVRTGQAGEGDWEVRPLTGG